MARDEKYQSKAVKDSPIENVTIEKVAPDLSIDQIETFKAYWKKAMEGGTEMPLLSLTALLDDAIAHKVENYDTPGALFAVKAALHDFKARAATVERHLVPDYQYLIDAIKRL